MEHPDQKIGGEPSSRVTIVVIRTIFAIADCKPGSKRENCGGRVILPENLHNLLKTSQYHHQRRHLHETRKYHPAPTNQPPNGTNPTNQPPNPNLRHHHPVTGPPANFVICNTKRNLSFPNPWVWRTPSNCTTKLGTAAVVIVIWGRRIWLCGKRKVNYIYVYIVRTLPANNSSNSKRTTCSICHSH